MMKSLINKTVQTIQKSLKYEKINESEFQISDENFVIYDAILTKTGERYTLFQYDIMNNTTIKSKALSGIGNLKKFLHPNIVKYVDEIINDNSIMLITEYIIPLKAFIQNIKNYEERFKENFISWGILQILKLISFLHNSCGIYHSNIKIDNIFINYNFEWKLFGFEYSQSIEEYNDQINSDTFLNEFINQKPPHLDIDYYGILIVIYKLFNENNNFTNVKNIPLYLRDAYKTILNSRIKSKMIQSLYNSQCFKNEFISFMSDFINLQVLSHSEICSVFNKYESLLNSLPIDFLATNITNALINRYNYGAAINEILELIIKIIARTDKDFQLLPSVYTFLCNSYSFNDRLSRKIILTYNEQLIKHFNKDQIQSIVIPAIISGLLDSSIQIKEISIKALVPTVPLLSDSATKNKVLNCLARLQSDQNDIVRANTNVCIGKLAPCLPQDTLTIALLRGLSDSNYLSRRAVVITMLKYPNLFNIQQLTKKLIPTLSLHLTDPEKEIRETVLSCIKSLLQRAEEFIATIPDCQPNQPNQEIKPSSNGWFIGNILSKFISKSTTAIQPPLSNKTSDDKTLKSQINNIPLSDDDSSINSQQDTPSCESQQNNHPNSDDFQQNLPPKNVDGWDWDEDWK